MTTLHGCVNTDSKKTDEIENKTSRTVEEAAVEAEFEPLFEFLSQEEKDFSNVNSFVSDLRIMEKTNTVLEENSLLLKTYGSDRPNLSGYFREVMKNQENKYDVRLNTEGELIFKDSVPQKYNSELYFVDIALDDIKNGKIVNYSSNHPETDLVTLTYEMDSNLPLVKVIETYYGIQDSIVSTTLSLSKQGDDEFDVLFILSTKEKSYSLGTLLVLKT